MQALPPGVSHASWSIPVLVDGHRTDIRGETWRLRGPALWPWLTLLLLFLAGSASLSLPRRAPLRHTAPIVFGSIRARDRSLSTFSGDTARVLATTAIGAGLAATALGALRYANSPVR